MLKIAVFGPMPRPIAPITASENPGAFISTRKANRRSDHRTLMTLREPASTWPTRIPLNPCHLASRERFCHVRLRDEHVRLRTEFQVNGYPQANGGFVYSISP